MVHKAGEVPFGWAIRLNCTCIYIYIYIFFFFFFLLPQSINEVPGRSRSSRTDDNLNYNRLNWLTDVACKKNNKERKRSCRNFLDCLNGSVAQFTHKGA